MNIRERIRNSFRYANIRLASKRAYDETFTTYIDNIKGRGNLWNTHTDEIREIAYIHYRIHFHEILREHREAEIYRELLKNTRTIEELEAEHIRPAERISRDPRKSPEYFEYIRDVVKELEARDGEGNDIKAAAIRKRIRQ